MDIHQHTSNMVYRWNDSRLYGGCMTEDLYYILADTRAVLAELKAQVQINEQALIILEQRVQLLEQKY